MFVLQAIKGFHKNMNLQDFYQRFGASDLISEDIKENDCTIKYFFYYVEEEKQVYIFTFHFKRIRENSDFLLFSVTKTPIKKFYKYENLKNLDSERLSKILMF